MAYIRWGEDQIQKAGQVDLLDYIKRQGYPVVEYANGYWKVQGYGGLLVSPEKNAWFWESESSITHKVGGGPIQFVMTVEKKTFPEAVKILLKETSNGAMRHAAAPPVKTAEKSGFRLPAKGDTYKHMFAYLTNSRQIDTKIVQDFVSKKMIYEDKNHNCIFVGTDDVGIPRFASIRGTNPHVPFKGNPKGADKRYPFCSPGISNRVFVFEAPIDMLSYMTLLKEKGLDTGDHYISLAGVSLIGLDGYLERHPDITYIGMCTDNDEEGQKCFSNAYQAYRPGRTVKRLSPAPCKDFNEDLIERHFQQYLSEQQQRKEAGEAAQEILFR